MSRAQRSITLDYCQEAVRRATSVATPDHPALYETLTTSNSEGMPLAISTEANTAAPRDTVPVSLSVTLLTKLQSQWTGYKT